MSLIPFYSKHDIPPYTNLESEIYDKGVLIEHINIFDLIKNLYEIMSLLQGTNLDMAAPTET